MGLFHTNAPQASGIVQLAADGLIEAFEEKPAQPVGNLANAGIYVGRQSLFDAIPRRDAVVDFGRDVFPHLTKRMYGVLLGGFLMDIGTPAALALASRQWLERGTAPDRLQGSPS